MEFMSELAAKNAERTRLRAREAEQAARIEELDKLDRVAPFEASIADRDRKIAEQAAEIEWLKEQHETEMLKVIDQRDAAEECVSDIFFKVTGQSPEWSNKFEFSDALEEIEDVATTLRKSLSASLAQCKTLGEALEPFAKAASRCEAWHEDAHVAFTMRVIHLRKARAALSRISGVAPEVKV